MHSRASRVTAWWAQLMSVGPSSCAASSPAARGRKGKKEGKEGRSQVFCGPGRRSAASFLAGPGRRGRQEHRKRRCRPGPRAIELPRLAHAAHVQGVSFRRIGHLRRAGGPWTGGEVAALGGSGAALGQRRLADGQRSRRREFRLLCRRQGCGGRRDVRRRGAPGATLFASLQGSAASEGGISVRSGMDSLSGVEFRNRLQQECWP